MITESKKDELVKKAEDNINLKILRQIDGKCSSPWKRILEKVKILADNKKGYEVKLLSRGWEPTCKCNIEETKLCLVLDPFSGMATTGLAAIDHFQNYVGIELNEKYLKESRKRLYGTELFIEEVKEIGEF